MEIIMLMLGYAIGSLFMWIYFARYSGLKRTRGEFYLARGIGDEAINVICENLRKSTVEHFGRKIKPPRSAPPAPPRQP